MTQHAHPVGVRNPRPSVAPDRRRRRTHQRVLPGLPRGDRQGRRPRFRPALSPGLPLERHGRWPSGRRLLGLGRPELGRAAALAHAAPGLVGHADAEPAGRRDRGAPGAALRADARARLGLHDRLRRPRPLPPDRAGRGAPPDRLPCAQHPAGRHVRRVRGPDLSRRGDPDVDAAGGDRRARACRPASAPQGHHDPHRRAAADPRPPRDRAAGLPRRALDGLLRRRLGPRLRSVLEALRRARRRRDGRMPGRCRRFPGPAARSRATASTTSATTRCIRPPSRNPS
jgi:hypothetical protein